MAFSFMDFGGFGDLESWASGVLGFVSRTWGLWVFLKPRALGLSCWVCF